MYFHPRYIVYVEVKEYDAQGLEIKKYSSSCQADGIDQDDLKSAGSVATWLAVKDSDIPKKS